MAGNASLAVRHGPFAEALLSSAKVLFEGSWGINSAKDNEAFAEDILLSNSVTEGMPEWPLIPPTGSERLPMLFRRLSRGPLPFPASFRS